jgi:transposase
LARGTVRRFSRAAQDGGFPERRPRPARRTQLTPFDAYLRVRWAEGCHNAAALWRELRGQGFTGGLSAVGDYVRPWRGITEHLPFGTDTDSAPSGAPIAPTRRVPPAARSSRAVTWLLLRRLDALTDHDRDDLTALFAEIPDLGVAHGLVQDFAALVREGREPGRWDERDLASWVRLAKTSDLPELAGFASGLLLDWQAVRAAVSSPWSNGQTEGQVTRIKALKRQMYGRANFDLLRTRFLHTSGP